VQLGRTGVGEDDLEMVWGVLAGGGVDVVLDENALDLQSIGGRGVGDRVCGDGQDLSRGGSL